MSCFSFPGDPSTSPSLSQTTSSKDADDQARKNMTSKNRGKRKADASSSQDSELEVWEETHLRNLLLFSHFLSLSNMSETHEIIWFYIICFLIPEQEKLNWPSEKRNVKTHFSMLITYHITPDAFTKSFRKVFLGLGNQITF